MLLTGYRWVGKPFPLFSAGGKKCYENFDSQMSPLGVSSTFTLSRKFRYAREKFLRNWTEERKGLYNRRVLPGVCVYICSSLADL